MTAVPAGPARHARLHLAGGQTLMQAVTAALAGPGWRSATLLLLGGPMARAVYHTSVLTPGGPRWIDYGPGQEIAAPAWLVMGSATFGRTAQGGPALHCHAVLSGADGLAGGHLAPDSCVLGAEGLVAHATSGAGAVFQVRRDPATGFDLLTPRMTQLVLVRLGAGVDLVEGLEAEAAALGIRDALVRGGPGSLMRASLHAGGAPIPVAGPAAEILTMVGELVSGRADLHGTVGDPNGRVFGGRFERGKNPVCITVELALEVRPLAEN